MMTQVKNAAAAPMRQLVALPESTCVFLPKCLAPPLRVLGILID